MKFLSVCSGIEAASVAWEPLGWKAAGFAEIEPFPSAVLKHHYPSVSNHGDMTALPSRLLSGQIDAPDVLCGGTPCQAFSVAGLRKSLDDARGNLSLTFCEIANAIDLVRLGDGDEPCIVFWENVPGVLSTKDNAFGCFLAGLAGEDEPLQPAGGKWTDAGVVLGPQRAVAWRILDAQYFGLAQRRRRVFVVASAREDFDPAAVLLEFDGVRRDSAPSRETGQRVAGTIEASLGRSRGAGTPIGAIQAFGGNRTSGPIDVAPALNACGTASGRQDFETEAFITQPYTLAIRGRGDSHNLEYRQDGTANALLTPNGGRGGIGVGAIAHAFDARQSDVIQYGDKTGPLDTDGHSVAVAWSIMPQNSGRDYKARQVDVLQPLMAAGVQHGNQGGDSIQTAMQVRRLTPVECERLQGFPDGYTAIPWRNKPASECPDGPRYKALGNSWAVPVVRWIGQRIQWSVWSLL